MATEVIEQTSEGAGPDGQPALRGPPFRRIRDGLPNLLSLSMSGIVPYLIRAYCDWIEDSSLTPHILVDCEKAGVVAPESFVKEGKIVLNISSSATESRLITNSSVSFKARFGGKSQKIIVPCEAVLAIYAQENGEGMFFDDKFETEGGTNKKPNLAVLD